MRYEDPKHAEIGNRHIPILWIHCLNVLSVDLTSSVKCLVYNRELRDPTHITFQAKTMGS